MTPLLEVQALTKTFIVRSGRRPALLHAVEAVDLAVMHGEAVGLVGESGCGKSTLARLISRLIQPDSGRILLDGRPIGATPPAAYARSALRQAIQMVFQDPTDSLNPRFTAFDAIADPVRQLLRPTTRAELSGRVASAAARVGLPPDLLDRRPHQLSGGQKARVGIARAIVVEPRLLVLDEPTSALDVSVQAVVLKLLMQMRRDTGVGILFASHDLNVVRLLCDRIIVMHMGRVVETGPVDQVFRAPAHPYTRALLLAIPRLPPAPRGTLPAPRGTLPAPRGVPERLEGEPRSPIDSDPNACLLHGRCPIQTARCAVEAPALRAIGPGRSARCHTPLMEGTTP